MIHRQHRNEINQSHQAEDLIDAHAQGNSRIDPDEFDQETETEIGDHIELEQDAGGFDPITVKVQDDEGDEMENHLKELSRIAKQSVTEIDAPSGVCLDAVTTPGEEATQSAKDHSDGDGWGDDVAQFQFDMQDPFGDHDPKHAKDQTADDRFRIEEGF